MRVAAIGRTRMLYNAVSALAARGHEVALIVTSAPAPEYDVSTADFETLASQLAADFLSTNHINDPSVIQVLRRSHGTAAISVNWPSLIRAEACAAFPLGILNAHAGDLPRFRGNAPVAWAILGDEASIGVTIHVMDPEKLDAGPIVLKRHIPLHIDTYVGDVFAELNECVPSMFVEAIEGLQSGRVTPVPQPSDPREILRCYPRRPEDGRLNWNLGAAQLARLVRASSEPFAGAFTTFEGDRLIVWRARHQPFETATRAVPGQVLMRDLGTGEVHVAAQDAALVLQWVEHGRSGRVRATDLIRSNRDRLGETR